MGFSQGVSGLNASSSNLNVIGNNIANSGTTGFKEGSAQFADVYAGSQVGLGVQVAGISQNFTQGAVTTTGNAMDVAITSGDGFFRMASPSGNVSYSRDGQFNMDSNGYIVDSGGLRVTGYQVGANGTIAGGSPTAMQLPTAAMSPNATTQISAQFNLNSSDTIPATTPFNANDSTSYNYSNALTAYDSLGNSHEITNFFVKSGASTWNVYQTLDGHALNATDASVAAATTASASANATAAASALAAAAPGATAAQITQAATDATAAAAATTALTALTSAGSSVGSLAFDSSGKLITPANATLTPGAIPFSNGAAAMNYSLNLSGTTQFGSADSVSALTQNGYTSGQLTSFAINSDGTVSGQYSNQQTKTLGQIVLASFANPNGLQSDGGNVMSATAASGQALLSAPGSGTKAGSLTAGALEASNVDLTSELVNLIIAQRTYQANAQTIKTQDEIMQTLVTGL